MGSISIEELQKQFSVWRRNKKSRGERIPEDLWNQAVYLCNSISTYQVSRKLSLSYSELKARSMLQLGGLSPRPLEIEESSAGFIQLSPASTTQSNSQISIKSNRHEVSIQCSGLDFEFAITKLLSSMGNF